MLTVSCIQLYRHYVIECSVSYVITPPPHDPDRESWSDWVLGSKAYDSLNTSVLYSVVSSGLKIWSISVIR